MRMPHTMITTLFLDFLHDERGAESLELGVTGAIVAGGAVAGLVLLKDKLEDKQGELARKLQYANPD
jgi:Flp pilus assembly pilin Flp